MSGSGAHISCDHLLQEQARCWGKGLPPARRAAFRDWVVRQRSALGMAALRAAGSSSDLAQALSVIPQVGGADNQSPTAGEAVALQVLQDAGRAAQPLLHAQLLLRQGAPDRAVRAALRRSGVRLPGEVGWAVATDLANPWRTVRGQRAPGAAASDPPDALVAAWLRRFNAPLREADLEPVTLDPLTSYPGVSPAGTPFAALRSIADVAGAAPSDALVTIVVSAYQPTADLLMSVRSLLDQSWTELEIVIVDDASPGDNLPLWKAVTNLDPRIRLVHATENLGTYAARNLVLREAAGEFITFHDFDDFAHPRRIEVQVAALRARPDVIGCRSSAIRAFGDLSLTLPGASPMRVNASSLLLRTAATRDLVGGFDWVRKSADVEYPARLVAAGARVADIENAPLAITQLRADSLSRADGTPGWLHWTRLAYRDAYEEWHRQLAAGVAPLTDQHPLPVFAEPVVRPFPLAEPQFAARQSPVQSNFSRGSGSMEQDFPLVVVGDWRSDRIGLEAQLTELESLARAAHRRGQRLAVAQLEAATAFAPDRGNPSRGFQALVNSGVVELVHTSQELNLGSVLLAHPVAALLQDAQADRWRFDRLLLGHSEETLRDLQRTRQQDWNRPPPLSLPELAAAAGHLFGRPGQWLARDAHAVRDLAAAGIPEAALVPYALLPLVEAPRALRDRQAFQADSGVRPVVGHHLPDAGTFWGLEQEAVWATFGQLEVRLNHDGQAAARLLTGLPSTWVAYGAKLALPQGHFLGQLHGFAVPTGHDHPTLALAVAQAAASGVLPVLPAGVPAELAQWAVLAQEASVAATLEQMLLDATAVQGWWERVSELLSNRSDPAVRRLLG